MLSDQVKIPKVAYILFAVFILLHGIPSNQRIEKRNRITPPTFPSQSLMKRRLLQTKISLSRYPWNNVPNAAMIYRNFKNASLFLESDTAVSEDKAHASEIVKLLQTSPYIDFLANSTLRKLYNSFSGAGIVIPVYNHAFYNALLTIRNIREIHLCDLPIYVYYNGEEELFLKYREKLSTWNVTLLNLQNVFNSSYMQFDGWSNKPAMLLSAPCQECILMDSDVWWIQSPTVAFEQRKYKETGLLLYRDRTVSPVDVSTVDIDWIKSIVPLEAIKQIESFRMMRNETLHEVESGVVIIDKKRKFYGLLFVTYLNSKLVTPESYDTFLGDKETFWIGMSTMLESYHIDEQAVVTLGSYDIETFPDRLCSQQMAHRDENGNLMWVHGGVIEDKSDFKSKLQKFVVWADEVTNRWDFLSAKKICIKLFNETTNQLHLPLPISIEDQLKIEQTQHIWIDILKDWEKASYTYFYKGRQHERSSYQLFSWESPDFSLSELLEISKNNEQIPYILHQTWDSKKLSKYFEETTKKWKSSNPELKRILWTDEDNLLLMQMFHPEWLSFYQKLPRKIYKLYFIRYIYLLTFGGIYADLDTAAYKSIIPLLNDRHILLGEISHDKEWTHNIAVACMASRKEEAFLVFVISKFISIPVSTLKHSPPEDTGGPGLLKDALKEWKQMKVGGIHILPPGYWFGNDWRSFKPECQRAQKEIEWLDRCHEKLGDLYMITTWTHTWN